MSTEYKDNVGKRVLINWGIGDMIEAKVLEVSPSGYSVKIKTDTSTYWVKCFRHEIVEVLPDIDIARTARPEEKF